MASIGQLVRVVAGTAGLEENSIKLIARYVREAGLIDQKSTGAGAALMSSEDAAALLMAVNGTSLAKEAAETVREFSVLPICLELDPETELDEFKSINQRLLKTKTFGECLAELIAVLVDQIGEADRKNKDLRSALKIAVHFDRPNLTGSIFVYERELNTERMRVISHRVFQLETKVLSADVDRLVSVSISERTLLSIARAIAN